MALLIGLQVLIWFASGMLVSLLPIERVRGEHLMNRSATATLPGNARMVDPAVLIARVGTPVEAIGWRMLLDRPVVEVTTPNRIVLFDAASGEPLTPIGADLANRIARNAWKGAPGISARTSRVTEESPEYRGSLPA